MRSQSEILSTLQALECELHQPTTQDAERLCTLLHPNFREFRRSGAEYTLATVLEQLTIAADPVIIHAQDFSALELAPDVILLTYRSAQVISDGTLERHTNRTSLWRRETVGWQMIFHQGTATPPFVQVHKEK